MTGARTIAIAMQKGGVGKTTTAIALGAALALAGDRVLLVDFDPQASLTEAVGGRASADVADALTTFAVTGQWASSRLPGLIQAGVGTLPAGSLDLLPGHRNLAVGEVRWYHADRAEGARDSQVLYMLLVQYRAAYDWVIIDSPPALGLLTVNALAAAHELLVPIAPEPVAIHGLHRLDLTLQDMRRFGINRGLRVTGVVPTRVRWAGGHLLRQHAASLAGIRQIATHWGAAVHEAIPDGAIVLAAMGASVPLPVYAPHSRAARAYSALAAQLRSTAVKEIPGDSIEDSSARLHATRN